MLLVKRNKNIYSLGVGISTVLEILGHFIRGNLTNMYGHDLIDTKQEYIWFRRGDLKSK
jgi:hypothetical protein